ncbi:MAG: malto-oligosyltrehalose trehalohydrolase [Parachlamydiaceae bacterium]|nr:malto-oligosyltrehalose trehalohydrolase [Parachlamydiaceae bacterium]
MIKRQYPIGAEVFPQGVHFRVWAPDYTKVDLVLENKSEEPIHLPMKKETEGYFSLLTKQAKDGTHYRFSLGGEHLCADPASRYQPLGPDGPSRVCAGEFKWTDSKWKGVKPYNHIAYEIHIGTFTEVGTFEEATKHLPYLADLGITLIEMMPLADFPGHFGWGYDGVNLFAPTHLYGNPYHLKSFINKAHALGIAVILDVVYNHLGPEGNQLTKYSKDYLSEEFDTDWGEAVNFNLAQTREYFLTNATYWIKEFHFDGLRIDATPWFYSSTPIHILEELTKVIKMAGGKRKTLVIGENEPQDTKLLRSYKDKGYGFDILWNDDFHHSARVRLTGKREAYYTDYLGNPQEFISLLKYGFLYQGQYYQWQKKNRGTPHLKIPFHAMMVFLENHDQIANSGYGERLHLKADAGNYKVLTAFFLLAPNTPLIFQGQEFNSSKPFCYFADHSPELSTAVKKGRKKELSQFPRLKIPEAQRTLPDPENPLTFTKCKLDHSEREKNAKFLHFFKDLIKIKRNDPVLSRSEKVKIDGAVIGTDAFIIRFFNEKHGDRLLIINFGVDLFFNPAPEPLLAAEQDKEFKILWSSESLEYGGEGTPPILVPFWKILGHSAILLHSVIKPKA